MRIKEELIEKLEIELNKTRNQIYNYRYNIRPELEKLLGETLEVDSLVKSFVWLEIKLDEEIYKLKGDM